MYPSDSDFKPLWRVGEQGRSQPINLSNFYMTKEKAGTDGEVQKMMRCSITSAPEQSCAQTLSVFNLQSFLILKGAQS